MIVSWSVYGHDWAEFLLEKEPTRVDITLAPKKLIRTRRASEGNASEPSLARRVSMCKDAKLSCRGNIDLKD